MPLPLGANNNSRIIFYFNICGQLSIIHITNLGITRRTKMIGKMERYQKRAGTTLISAATLKVLFVFYIQG